MSDLTANNCGCNTAANNSYGCGFGGNSIIWIILLLSCCGNGDSGCGMGCGSGLLGSNSGCGNNSCDWLIWILLISCFCGNNNGCC